MAMDRTTAELRTRISLTLLLWALESIGHPFYDKAYAAGVFDDMGVWPGE